MSRWQNEGTGALKPDQKYCYRDYRQWPEDERWELIDGRAYGMSPAPRLNHQNIVLALSFQLVSFLRGKPCKPFIAPTDVFWTADPAADLDSVETVTQPDVLVVCDKSKRREQGIAGAPDFIIEISSPSTAYRDQTEKRQLHERFGVKEYWIVNPDTLEVWIYLLDQGKYQLPTAANLREPVAVRSFSGLVLQVQPEDL
jgi:Uma2 family endonuclease